MILVDWQITDRIERGYIGIDPYNPELIQPNSIDIRLGNHFVWYTPGDEIIDPYIRDTVTGGTEEMTAESSPPSRPVCSGRNYGSYQPS